MSGSIALYVALTRFIAFKGRIVASKQLAFQPIRLRQNIPWDSLPFGRQRLSQAIHNTSDTAMNQRLVLSNLYVPSRGLHKGVEQATMNWWFGHNVLGLFYTPLALGSIYYFLPKIIGRPVQSYNLSLLGFWGLAFFYGQVGGHHLIGGPDIGVGGGVVRHAVQAEQLGAAGNPDQWLHGPSMIRDYGKNPKRFLRCSMKCRAM